MKGRCSNTRDPISKKSVRRIPDERLIGIPCEDKVNCYEVGHLAEWLQTHEADPRCRHKMDPKLRTKITSLYAPVQPEMEDENNSDEGEMLPTDDEIEDFLNGYFLPLRNLPSEIIALANEADEPLTANDIWYKLFEKFGFQPD